jgi:uncharacterized SAM-binding protein YcdF (DUF218 family)
MEWDEYLGFDLGENPPLHFVKGLMLPSLVDERELPAIPTISEDAGSTLIYVLGGSQESLKSRIRLAATLYHRVSGSRVLFMSVRGITEYNPGLGRNYTHDEWVTHEMTEVKVPATDIEFIAMPAGVFGTLREARHIAALVKRRQNGRLILVTSAYHTRRVLIAFSHYLKGKGELYIYGSDETVRFRHLMAEYIKVPFYRYILI